MSSKHESTHCQLTFKMTELQVGKSGIRWAVKLFLGWKTFPRFFSSGSHSHSLQEWIQDCSEKMWDFHALSKLFLLLFGFYFIFIFLTGGHSNQADTNTRHSQLQEIAFLNCTLFFFFNLMFNYLLPLYRSGFLQDSGGGLGERFPLWVSYNYS